MNFFQPHYVRDYRRFVRKELRRHQGRDAGMQSAVGGSYETIGAREGAFLVSIGLQSDNYLIDVGCGSGRLSSALRDMPSLRYLGTDVVPDLIEYAVAKCARPDWQFCVVESITIPEQDCQADIVAFFSVFTHLYPRECFDYLREADRILKPSGQIVVSFLDRAIFHHRSLARHWLFRLVNRILGTGVKNTLLDRDDLSRWGERLGLECCFHGTEAVGQVVCVYRRPLQRLA
jgi:ubiquinone/menaquinone biosynthesis C-methylase UbiE